MTWLGLALLSKASISGRDRVLKRLRNKEDMMTETELKAIAAPAHMGSS